MFFFWCCVPLDGGFMKKKKIYEDFAQFIMLMDYWNVVLMKLKLWIIRYRFDWNHYGHTIKLSYYDVTIQLMKKSRQWEWQTFREKICQLQNPQSKIPVIVSWYLQISGSRPLWLTLNC